MSEDVDTRILEHNAGRTFSTKGYRPWYLFFKESYPNRAKAHTREKYLKSGTGKEQIKKRWKKAQLDTCLPDSNNNVSYKNET